MSIEVAVRDRLVGGGHFLSALLDCYENPTKENWRRANDYADSKNRERLDRVAAEVDDLRDEGYPFHVALRKAMAAEWELLQNTDTSISEERFQKGFRNLN